MMQQSRDNVELRITAGEKIPENEFPEIEFPENVGLRLGYNYSTLTFLVFLSSVMNKF